MSKVYNPFVHVEIYVNDMGRAVRFYEQVLGITMKPIENPDEAMDSQMMAFPWHEDAPNCGGMLVKMEGCGPSDRGTVPYFGCEDCAVELGRVAAAGGKVCRDKFPIGPHGFCGIATDSEGNTIGFHSMK